VTGDEADSGALKAWQIKLVALELHIADWSRAEREGAAAAEPIGLLSVSKRERIVAPVCVDHDVYGLRALVVLTAQPSGQESPLRLGQLRHLCINWFVCHSPTFPW
jgi:hypothetical protein